ncbi:MAG: Smr/MutS family protein [Desulfopila sp.]
MTESEVDRSFYESIMLIYCQICGNEIAAGSRSCLFCGSSQDDGLSAVSNPTRAFVHRTVDLEAGRSHVEAAMRRLLASLAEARALEIQALTLIHGYGSSGRGGVIRQECRKLLAHMSHRGEVREVIFGENFHRRSGPVRNLLRQYPQLAKNSNLNRGNKGTTLVIL